MWRMDLHCVCTGAGRITTACKEVEEQEAEAGGGRDYKGVKGPTAGTNGGKGFGGGAKTAQRVEWGERTLWQ